MHMSMMMRIMVMIITMIMMIMMMIVKMHTKVIMIQKEKVCYLVVYKFLTLYSFLKISSRKKGIHNFG
jgi:hypothetical protein